MRVRIGNTWYAPEDGTPIMVTLTPMDRLIINHMSPMDNVYAVFSEGDEKTMTQEDKIAWMTTETIVVKQ